MRGGRNLVFLVRPAKTLFPKNPIPASDGHRNGRSFPFLDRLENLLAQIRKRFIRGRLVRWVLKEPEGEQEQSDDYFT